ncbi:protein kinase [Gordonia sp. zg691]|uniref:protein kinase domain-containing protein n=1 Tax=Gordonia jinghuaiqii TaxID=2758710 RepID=UPI0016623D51|nr:protein kinase [Gordonia jinghuaiqii]MBD0861278.1 protein kinase [Gordonia jinghuaiqii]
MDVTEPGSLFAGYRVLSLLGRGGMGQVWLVEHPTLGRREALKIISPDPSDPSFHERFRNEARTAAALDHPGIVTVYTHGVENGSPWFSMTYLDGDDLTGAGPLPIDDVVAIVGKVGDALDYAHGRRVIHRDIKPANIVVSRDRDGRVSRVTVLDFGIARLIDGAKLTATNLFVGTLAYAAPELLTGEAAVPASDQYALACTTFQLLTGRQPFPGSTPMALISGHINSPVPRISDHVPGLAALDPVFARAMAKNPADRFASCSAFAAALTRAAVHTPAVRTPAVTPAPALAPTYQNHTPPPPFRGHQAPPVPSTVHRAGPFVPPGHQLPGYQPPGPPYPVHPMGPGGRPPGSGSGRRTAWIVASVLGVVLLVAGIVGTAVALSGSDSGPATPPVAGSTPPGTGGSTPAPGADGGFASIASSGETTCAVRGGELFCWGGNERGTIGDGTTTDQTRPVRINGIDDVSAVSMGGLGTTCAIGSGDLYCWGYGIGEPGREVTTPTRVPGLSDVTAVSVGLSICAISDGDAYCWRNNTRGQVGNGSTGSVDVPTRVAGLSNVTAVSTSHTTSCAIASGSAYCWGNNADGQIGDGTTTDRLTPTRVSGVGTPTSISTSLYSTCAVGDGAVYCWGQNDAGQLGDGTEQSRTTPRRIDVRGATEVSTAPYGGCAAAGGSAYCWGSRSTLPDRSPDRVNGLSGVSTVTTGSANVCAVAASKMYCWGLNGDGQLGNGTTTTSSEPQPVRFPA